MYVSSVIEHPLSYPCPVHFISRANANLDVSMFVLSDARGHVVTRVTCTERRDDETVGPSFGVLPGFVKIRSPNTLNLNFK